MHALTRCDPGGRWTVEFSISNTAIVTLHTNTEQSADAVRETLAVHVTDARPVNIGTPKTPKGPRGPFGPVK